MMLNASNNGYTRAACMTVADVVKALQVVEIRAQEPHPDRGPWSDSWSERDDLRRVLDALPAGWRAAVEATVPAAPQADDPLQQYLSSDDSVAGRFSRPPTRREMELDCALAQAMGWQVRDKAVTVGALTVRDATALQLAPLLGQRQEYLRAYVAEFAPVQDRSNPDALSPLCESVAKARRQLWRLRWDNQFKEVFWRLVYDGLPTAKRMHMSHDTCVCGPVGQPPGRRHHFWDCPVAQAVVAVMQQQLCVWQPSVAPLRPHHVLCMQCPVQGLHLGVWRVVCLAAVNAMDGGRAAANKLGVEAAEAAAAAAAAAAARQQAAVPQGQRLITALLQPAALTPAQQQHNQQVRQRRELREQQQQQQRQQAAAAQLAAARQQAVGRFWELLEDFVVLQAAPKAWLEGREHVVPPSHPFLRVVNGVMHVHCVAAAPAAG
jgi:pyruvate/2-oxoglutarate dehydrogenase complex dihydrolipoamide acyltransferase (E2) component